MSVQQIPLDILTIFVLALICFFLLQMQIITK